MSEVILQARGVTMAYGGKQVLGGLNLAVPKGEICGLLGPNGAGKTTLLNILTGLVRPDRGEIELFGRPFSPALLRRAGCLIDRPGLYGNRSAAENLAMRQTLLGIPEDRVSASLAQVGLSHTGAKHVRKFSQGMRQRLAIAMALMGSPELLLLDEPINGLDAMGMYDMRTLFASLNRDYGVTILITSHLLDEVSRIATCYAFLQNGALKQLTGKEVAEKSRQSAEIVTGDTPRASVVLDAFGEAPGGYEVMPDGSFRLYEGLDRLPELNAALVQAGIPVFSLTLKTQTLADFYLEETGEKKGGGLHA